MSALAEIVPYLEGYLGHAAITDYPGAYNGLQLESPGAVTRLGAAVDAAEPVLVEAARRGVDLLLVHHGLLWSTQRFTGPLYRKLKRALSSGLAVYSSHLPLDMHPEVGNNVQLARAVGLEKGTPAFSYKGQKIGLKFEVELTRGELLCRLEAALNGPVHLAPGGPEAVSRVGIVTGGAGSEVPQALAEQVDTFITGEGPHWSYTLAEEHGLNLFYGGHYATETFGVKALAAHLAERFGLPWEFIDHPTGL